MSGRREIARSYFLVARGNNRNNGANLGAVALNANNGLSNSNGNNWRSRLSNQRGNEKIKTYCRKTGGKTRPTKPETPHKANGNKIAEAILCAVKDAHKHTASRTERPRRA